MDYTSPIRRHQVRGRTVTACSECQRRKKKCNRQWPCDHCQSRHISHLCQFGPPRTRRHQVEPQLGSLDDSQPAGPPIPEIPSTSSQEACSLGVRELSYVDSDVFKVLQVESKGRSLESSKWSAIPDHVLQAMRMVPPRPYADTLVRNFFECVNYHYCILHQPCFMTQYWKWWSERRNFGSSPTSSSIIFTCLVLRICSNSTQFLMPSDIAQFESELGESISVLGGNYHLAAQTLSDFIPSGKGGLMNAQQHFLAATWFKGEGDFVSSWHQLAAAVREAQEIGIHNDSSPKQMAELDRELRRRLWCAVCTWDRFMVVTFNRAPIIQSGESVPLPNPRLDQLPDEPGIPSIVLAKVLENQLTSQFGDDQHKEISVDDKVSLIENWMSTLPDVFRVKGAEVRWDARHPRLVFQRLQLHTTGYMAQLMLLRSSVLNTELPDTQKLSSVVDISLKCMEVSRNLFDICFPQQAKYFMVPFAPFDNASFLCSILIKDSRTNKVPRRLEVIAAIGQALYMCNNLRKFTKLGATTWGILTALTSKLGLEATERRFLEQIEELGDTSSVVRSEIVQLQSQHHEFSINETENISQLTSISEAEWGMWEPTTQPVSEFGQVDLGVLDGVWDWNVLGLGDLGSHETRGEC